MPSANIYFSKEEDEKISEYSHSWNISKQDVVKRMVREFKVEVVHV